MYQFEMSSSGRYGMITYCEEGKELGIDWEISGVPSADILLAPVDFRRWSIPSGLELPVGKQTEILYRLREWLMAKKIRSDVDLPQPVVLSAEKCVWSGCQQKAIKGCAYCVQHYDLNLLRLA